MLCGAALSPCKKTRNRPARSTTATDTLLPFFAHSATAASAAARPMASDTSRCISTWACKDDGSTHAAIAPAARTIRIDMRNLPWLLDVATAPCATWPSGTGAAWKPHRSGIGQPDCTPFPVSATAAPGLCHPAPPLITHRAPGVVRCRMITVAPLADTAIELPHPLRYDGHSTSAA